PDRFVAADLLSQAEHDEDGSAICITCSKQMAKDIQAEIDQQLKQLDRTDIETASIQKNEKISEIDTLDNNFKLINKNTHKHFLFPIGVYDFLKKSSIIHYSENALQQEANYIQTIANMEELTGHSNAIKVRFSPE